MPLRDYQSTGKKNVLEAFKSGWDIVFLVLFTGGGKTVIFTDIIRDEILEGRRAMLMAHREELIFQAWNKLHQNKIYSGIIKAKEPENFHLPCQVCSVQTIARRKHLPEVTLVVVDEGHHVTADNSYGQIIRKVFEKNPNAKVLIVSATPYRLSGEGFETLLPGKKTKLIISQTLKQGIDNGWAVPLEYFVASIPDLSNVHISKGEYVEEDLRKAMELAPLVQSYKEHAEGTQCIIFAINIAHSHDIVKQYRAAGYAIEHLDANTDVEERQRILSDFRAGKITHISNVGILTEGSDFPNLVTVQDAAPTKSLSKFLQKIGRATRPCEELSNVLGTLPDKTARKAAIAASIKPFAIILDNCGAWIDHGLPDEEQNWERHFKGARQYKTEKLAVDEQMEILIYVAEDEQGVQKRFTNIKEIEGLKLIKVTREVRRKIVNLKAIKKFDELFAIAKRLPRINKPGYVAFEQYCTYCKSNMLLMVPEIWDYLERKLITEIKANEDLIYKNQEKYPGAYTGEMVEKSIAKIKSQGVSERFMLGRRQQYARDNATQLTEYMAAKIDGMPVTITDLDPNEFVKQEEAPTVNIKSLFDLSNI